MEGVPGCLETGAGLLRVRLDERLKGSGALSVVSGTPRTAVSFWNERQQKGWDGSGGRWELYDRDLGLGPNTADGCHGAVLVDLPRHCELTDRVTGLDELHQ